MKKKFTQFKWLAAIIMLVAAMVMPSAVWAQESTVTFTAKEGTVGFSNESFDKLIDGKFTSDDFTKWCLSFPSEGAYIIFSASVAVQVTGYSIVTGDDNASNPGRNPQSWAIYGCNDASADRGSESWVLIDQKVEDTDLQDVNYQKYDFTLSKLPSEKYQYFKMEITATKGASVLQMSELILAYTTCNHQWVKTDDVVAPTCTEGGYDVYECSLCHETKNVANNNGALGHGWESGTVVAPTCTKDGYTPQTCSRCQAEQKINIVNATGHQWGTDDICDVCGAGNSTPRKPQNGDGSEIRPFQIGTAAELYWFAALVNGDTSVEEVTDAKQFACATLTADIVVNRDLLSSLQYDESGNVSNGTFFIAWTPIGTSNLPYRGTFDGNNHTISGLYFNDVYSGYAGLFGCNAGKIINVGVIDSYFNGSGYIGGVCGYNYAASESTPTIENCYNTGTIIGSADEVGGVCGCNYADSERTSTIKNCYNTGMVSSSSSGDYSFGGVCGKNYANSNSTATIESSYNTGTVSGRGDYAGGVCGKNYAYGSSATATIKNCYNTGTVSGSGNYAGGVCGQNYADQMEYGVTATIESCYSTGTISGNYIGGICGQNYTNSNDGSCCAFISKCYYNSNFYTGNAVGNNNYGSVSDVEGKTTAQFMSGEVCYLLNGRYTYSVPWHQNLSAENGDACPVPVVEGTTANTVYQVNLLCGGSYNVGKTYANIDKDEILEHILPEAVTFNSEKNIYNKVCPRKGCGYAFNYYADAAGTIEATPNTEETEFTVASYTLTDATAYNSEAEFTATSLAYKRTFYDDKWMAVYVPFAINCSKLEPDYEMATINNFHEYEQEDGTYNVVLEVKRVTKGGTIPALTPCLIRMKTAPAAKVEKTLTFENAAFSAAADKSIDCSSVTRYYQFFGTLKGKTELTADTDFVLNAGKLYKTSESTVLLPQRWYLSATDRTSTPVETASMLRSISIKVIGDGEATGIEDIHVNTESGADASGSTGIYDLQGRKINSEPTKGMYIKNGKKYIK